MKMNCDARGSWSMNVACGILGVTLVLIGPAAWGQTGESAATEKGNTASRQEVTANARVDSRPFQTFYLTNAQVNDANEITVAVRNLLPPDVKIYLSPSQNAIIMRATPDELTLAQKIISDLDRPKKTYRLTFTTTETDGSKRIGVQHISIIVAAGQRTTLKQGSKVPVATGSYSAPGSNTGAQTQFTYIDVGMNFDAALDELANGARLRSKVEQLSIAEQTSGVGLQDPIIRQSTLEGTSFLTLGKPLVLGSIDIPGSTRHLDVEVVMEQVAK